MHTALCAFDDHAAAERARDRLLQAGFSRDDVHLQHRGARDAAYDPDGETRSDMLRHRGGVEHEVALSPDVVERVTNFFGHLFGRDHPRRGMWDDHVRGGRTVVVVDAHDEAEAERARAVLHEMAGNDTTRVHRPEQRPVRDIVAGSPVSGAAPLSTQPMVQPGAGLAADATSRVQSVETGMPRGDTGWTERRATTRQEERAVASGEQRPLDIGRADQANDQVGLRYADKDDADKPLAGRDESGRSRDGE